MPRFYLTPKQDDFNKIPELQICIAEPCTMWIREQSYSSGFVIMCKRSDEEPLGFQQHHRFRQEYIKLQIHAA